MTTNALTGTSGFQYAEWKGVFYPEKLPAGKMLPFYAEHFSTTEINYSFRQIPSAKAVAAWQAATPAGFHFSFKAPQQVTHFARLRDCAGVVDALYQAVSPLDHKLGAVLFQLPPGFKKDLPLLAAFLPSLPQGMKAAFEFRHESWLDDAVYEVLQAGDTALCIAESEDFVTPPHVTASFGYLRLRREDYTRQDMEKWAAWIQAHGGSWEHTYIYFRHEATGIGTTFARQMKALLA